MRHHLRNCSSHSQQRYNSYTLNLISSKLCCYSQPAYAPTTAHPCFTYPRSNQMLTWDRRNTYSFYMSRFEQLQPWFPWFHIIQLLEQLLHVWQSRESTPSSLLLFKSCAHAVATMKTHQTRYYTIGGSRGILNLLSGCLKGI